MQNKEHLYYIDKTKCLEEGISRFPSIYIEGNAAAGKTVAVNMLLKKHPEISSFVLVIISLSNPKNLENLFVPPNCSNALLISGWNIIIRSITPHSITFDNM